MGAENGQYVAIWRPCELATRSVSGRAVTSEAGRVTVCACSILPASRVRRTGNLPYRPPHGRLFDFVSPSSRGDRRDRRDWYWSGIIPVADAVCTELSCGSSSCVERGEADFVHGLA